LEYSIAHVDEVAVTAVKATKGLQIR